MSSSSRRRHKFNRKGRRAGDKVFHIEGDFCMELGYLCTDDDDDQQLREMYGLQCWLGGEAGPWGCTKMKWYHIIQDFQEAASSWSNCDDRREMALTHRP